MIDFDGWRDPKGYRFGKPVAGLRSVVRNGHNSDQLEHYRPLDRGADLFLVFAKIATDPEGVLDFVRCFGPLTASGNDEARGDSVEHVMLQARTMRQLLEETPKLQRRHPEEPWDAAPSSTLRAAVVWDPTTKALTWQFRPNTLLDGLWLQFGQTLTSGVQIRHCLHCGSWFETGPGTGRRLDAKFCSDQHRIAFNSLKRSRETI